MADDEGVGTPVFQLGLALAGAISAGSYTAGVMDFLFQALSEWDTRRGQPGVPKHRVVLKVIAGASAGAITGALGVIALARGLRPRKFTPAQIADRYPDRYTTHQEYQCVFPSLYRTWVELPAMVGVDGVGGLLSTSDIEAGTSSSKPTVRSLLNASLLDDIKRSAIEPSEREADGSIMPPVSFIARNLHVYMMISNMRGIPYKVAFGRNSYGMQTIGDRIHYVVTDLGDYDLRDENSWVNEDARKASYTISVTTLPRRRADQLGEWDLYGTAALASGAFPIGLASRRLSFPWSHYLDRNYPVPIPPDVTIQPSFPPDIQKMYEAFSFESVDGGLVNNDPFDYAQYALVGGPATEPVNGQSVDRAIIMVAPFPEPPEFLPENSPSPAVTAIMRALFPALVNQARFRTSELAPAVNERDFSRYLIAPLRRIPRDDSVTLRAKQPPIERFPIACGLLGGFGGFLDELFRSHDFQLGRRNCQQFLRNSFLVPSDNVIIGRREMTDSLPVIPLVGSAADPIPLPLWPQMSQRDFDRLCNRMRERLDRVIPALVNSQTPSVKLRTALKLGWLLFLRSRIFEFVRLTLISDLVRRGQIQGWDAAEYASETVKSFERSADDVRAVIAELINPAYDFRTVRGIANCAHMPIGFVEALLQKLSQRSAPEQFRVWANNYGYTHFMRRPGFLGRRGIVQWFNRWWNAPTVD
jgi:hypothetical protein